MENFVVSARKYRPSTFDTVVGQPSIVQTLKNAIRTQQIAQAFLFTGPRGVGKTTCARIFAKIINCENLRPDIEPCNECESCRSFNNNTSFNIIELDAASNSQVEQMRNFIEQVRIPPQHGKFKVYIIDEVHMLSSASFNAFLKTLEEPPPFVKFILATTEKHKIIATILSRCQIYDFKRITVDDIVNHLQFVAQKEEVDAEPEALHVIALKADGAMRDSLSIFDQLVTYSGKHLTYSKVIESLNVLSYEDYFGMVWHLLTGNMSEAIVLLDDIIERGFEGQSFLNGLGDHFRNLWLCKDSASISLLEVPPALRQLFIDQSSACSLAFLVKALNLINQCDINFKASNNRRLLLEITLINICNTENPVNQAKPAPPIKPVPSPTPPSSPAPAPKTEPVASTAMVTESSKTYTTAPSATLENEEKKPEPESKKMPEAPSIQDTVRTNGLPKLINIGGLNKPQKAEEPQTEFYPQVSDSVHENKSFTQDELETVWSRFLESLDENNSTLLQAIRNQKPRLADENTVEMVTLNLILEKDILDHKDEILEYLRTHLSNRKIQFKTVIAESQIQVKAYSPKDKFQQLINLNPLLGDFVKRFDLELEL